MVSRTMNWRGNEKRGGRAGLTAQETVPSPIEFSEKLRTVSLLGVQTFHQSTYTVYQSDGVRPRLPHTLRALPSIVCYERPSLVSSTSLDAMLPCTSPLCFLGHKGYERDLRQLFGTLLGMRTMPFLSRHWSTTHLLYTAWKVDAFEGYK